MSAEHKQELATKADLDLRLAATEARIKAELTAERARFRREMMKWTAGMLLAQAALIATLVKLL